MSALGIVKYITMTTDEQRIVYHDIDWAVRHKWGYSLGEMIGQIVEQWLFYGEHEVVVLDR